MVNQYGTHAVCIGTVNGDVYMNSSDNSENYRQIFRYISADLRSWRSCLYDDKHIPRKQTCDLCAWIDAEHNKEKERVALLAQVMSLRQIGSIIPSSPCSLGTMCCL